MAQRGTLVQFSDLIAERKKRAGNVVYFVRITNYNNQVEALLKKCVEKARTCGAMIDGKLAAPDVRQSSYYQEMMGDAFELQKAFIDSALGKWMPRLAAATRSILADSFYNMLVELQNAGKNINILKNAFIKYMCWLFYKFEQTSQKITEETAPVILYYVSGDVSIYEIQMLSIMCSAGCDVILVEPQGDQNYLKSDAQSRFSQLFQVTGGGAFPPDFSIKTLLNMLNQRPQPVAQNRINSAPASNRGDSNSLPNQMNTSSVQNNRVVTGGNDKRVNQTNAPMPQRPLPPEAPRPIDFGPEPKLKLITNSWATAAHPLKDILTPFGARSLEAGTLCNAFCWMNGVENASTYENDLYQFYKKMKESKRRVVILNNGLDAPSPDEIAKIQRGNYRFPEDMVRSLAINLSLGVNVELQKYAVRAFAEILLEEARKPGAVLSRCMNAAVYLLCWFKRLQSQLFADWSAPAAPCLIYFGACKKDKEILFLRMLARMPVDVLILTPNLNDVFTLEDPKLSISMNLDSLDVDHFPVEERFIQVMTEEYQVEQDLDGIDCGVYRPYQFSRASSVPLYTSYDEISYLWELETKERPNFEVVNGTVKLPVLFAKISGVEQPSEDAYWLSVKPYITLETVVIKSLPHLTENKLTSIATFAKDFCKNGKVSKERIKSHHLYPYSILRIDMQEHMLDKLQELIDKKIIKGTGHGCTDYMIIASALSLGKEIQRLLMQFDFTRKNPKVLVLNTAEVTGSLQDAIQLAYLSLIGFDILIFVPTGVACFENWYNFPIVNEYIKGDYQYSYSVPNFETLESKQRGGFFSIFRRN